MRDTYVGMSGGGSPPPGRVGGGAAPRAGMLGAGRPGGGGTPRPPALFAIDGIGRLELGKFDGGGAVFVGVGDGAMFRNCQSSLTGGGAG